MARTKVNPCMDPNDLQHTSWVLLLMVVGEDILDMPCLCVHFASGSKVRAAEKKRIDEQTALAYFNLLATSLYQSQQDLLRVTSLPIPLAPLPSLPSSKPVAHVGPNTAEDGPHCSTVNSAPGMIKSKAHIILPRRLWHGPSAGLLRGLLLTGR